MKCPRCHEDQPEGTKFCMSCGAKFAYVTRPTPAAAEAAFAPTLATDLGTAPGTAPGTATPRGVPPAPAPTPVVTPAAIPVRPPTGSAAPATEDRSVIVATVAGKLVGLDAESGVVAWEHAIDPGTPQLIITAGMVLAAVGQSLYCCEYRTGRPMWRAALSAASTRVTMVVEPDRIYAFGAGVVDAFDHQGRKVWTRTVMAGAMASGAIGLPGNVSQADRD